MKIAIDPGHGGANGRGDPGAVANSLQEADFNLIVSSIVSIQLSDLGHEIIQTRVYDKFITLESRCDIANKSEADLFVSIHANASTDTRANGREVLYISDSGKKLAAAISHSMNEFFPEQKDRGLKKRNDLHVLRHTRMPAALVECGFLTNMAGNKLLKDEDNQVKMATAISLGINWFAMR